MAELTDASKTFADASVSRLLAERTADEWAAFVLPYLTPGMSLVDVGCGPGSITLGLAAKVAPGQVIGIDIEPAQVERAATAAAAQHVTNALFKVGNAYDVPLGDKSVDVIFANTLLNYLQEPLRALQEFRRLLKPDGFVAIRETDATTIVIEPPSAAVEAAVDLSVRYRNLQGNQANGRRLRALLVDSGFTRIKSQAFAHTYGENELGNTVDAFLRAAPFRAAALQHGWTSEAALEQILTESRVWSQRPDAFAAQLVFTVLGWAPEGEAEEGQ
jgi:ubiquinone/menaquinone biosynthesis C-methylase UbiE